MSEKNNKLELWVVDIMKRWFPNSRVTKNSGGSTEQGDVLNPYFHIECKMRSTKDFSIKREVWYKTKSECPNDKTPLYIIQNQHGDRLVVMDAIEFFNKYVNAYLTED